MFRILSAALVLLLTLTACGGPVEDTRPGQPVKQRQEAFKAMLRSFEPMRALLRAERFQAEEFARQADRFVSLREAPWSHFGPDTNYPPTKAKAAVWERPQAFEDERQRFFERGDALLQAARSGDKATIQAAYDEVYASCKSCHDAFKK